MRTSNEKKRSVYYEARLVAIITFSDVEGARERVSNNSVILHCRGCEEYSSFYKSLYNFFPNILNLTSFLYCNLSISCNVINLYTLLYSPLHRFLYGNRISFTKYRLCSYPILAFAGENPSEC